MHVVIWTSKEQRFATPSAAIVEVIPMVQSRPQPAVEPWLIGLFDYRGTLLPLLDSSRLMGHAASEIRMSSRILVIRTDGEAGGHTVNVGLVVEHVLGAEILDFDADGAHPPVRSSGMEFLGPVVLTPSGTVQLTIPARLPAIAS